MSVGKASIQRAAAKNTAEAKTTKAATKTANKTAAGKTTGRAAAKAAPKVVTPMDSQEIQLKFLSGNRPAEEGKPVKIAEDLPVYLL